MDFGAFVTILPGKDGLVHISEISEERVESVSDVLSEGQVIQYNLEKQKLCINRFNHQHCQSLHRLVLLGYKN